ncbi:snaclec B9-like [Mizuhopecten yessoensis]|uniref:snaclec B9-like n=1 Tax=Mizuhopecten yessoensis TaxID=6573 RepID=UPI000B459014|nr:snaclec B9-like [Mizuhopecten yessoensis]
MEIMRAVFLVLVFVQVDITHQQNILPEHRRRHCQALQTSDIMEQAMPELRRIIEAESAKVRRKYEAILATLKGGILLTCEAGWVYYDDNCYLFLRGAKGGWQNVREKCQSRGAYLAEIRSAEENSFVKSEARKVRDTGVLAAIEY